MTRFILPLILLVATLASLAAADKAQVIAIKMHADWCGSCKAIGTSFEELQEKFDTKPVLYVTLDHTRDYQRQQSLFLLQGLGLDQSLASHAGKTGFILLVDADSKQVLAKLTREHSFKEMGAKLAEVVDSASKS